MRRTLVLLAATFMGVTACGADAITVTRARDATVTLVKGDQLTIVLQTIGPGEYASPPSVSSSAVQFLSVNQAAMAVPAGPTQEFHFRAVSTGQAIVVFQHTGDNPTVTDTIVVR